MQVNYKVIIYKNRKHHKKIKSTEKYITAYRNFKKLLNNNHVYFPQFYKANNQPVKYEIAILGKKGKKLKNYTTKSDFFIKKIKPYYIEEKFINKTTNKKVTFENLIKISNDNNDVKTCIVSNNNLIICYSLSNHIELFTLKNKNDANRLFETFKSYVIKNYINLILFFDYYTFEFQQEVYSIIEKKLNIKKDYLYKIQTH